MSLFTFFFMLFAGLAIGFALGLVTHEMMIKPPREMESMDTQHSISRGDCIPPVLHESYALKYAVRALPLDKT